MYICPYCPFESYERYYGDIVGYSQHLLLQHEEELKNNLGLEEVLRILKFNT